MGEVSALPTPKLKPEDLQDNIFATVGDALTALLEEELATEAVAKKLNHLKQKSELNQPMQLPPILKFRLGYYFLYLYLKYFWVK